MRLKTTLYVFAFLSVSTLALGQKVKLKRANSLYGGVVNGEQFDRVIGNVLFTQKNVSIYCDSAHFFKSKNLIDAFGRIRIQEGDSIKVTASSLSYDGNTKIAHLQENIIFKKLGSIALYTDFLDYYRQEKKANYFNGGKLIDDSDTLISDKGYYNIRTGMASFKKNVVGRSKDYKLTSDTIQYDTRAKVIFFVDSATITNSDGDIMVYKNGSYSTTEKIFALHYGTTTTSSYILKGDDYHLNDIDKIYTIENNMSITLIEDSITIHGNSGRYSKLKGIAKVYGDAYLEKIDRQNDTLFMSADTLVSIEKKIDHRKPSAAKDAIQSDLTTVKNDAINKEKRVANESPAANDSIKGNPPTMRRDSISEEKKVANESPVANDSIKGNPPTMRRDSISEEKKVANESPAANDSIKDDPLTMKSDSISEEKKVANESPVANDSIKGDPPTIKNDSISEEKKVANESPVVNDSIKGDPPTMRKDSISEEKKVANESPVANDSIKGDPPTMRRDSISEEKKVANESPVANDSIKGDPPTMKSDSVKNQKPTIKKDSIEKIVLAYHNVKIFKTDLQGIADSLVFSTRDSTLRFFKDPVLWANNSQMTADSIYMVMRNKAIHRVYFIKNPFVASRDSLANFNQMKGRKMTAYFSNQAITHVDIDGNGETIYFVIEKNKNSTTPKFTFMGVNHILCSNMRIFFENQEVSEISFYTNPDASFIPPFILKKEDQELQGFLWRGEEKPRKEDVVKKSKKEDSTKQAN